MEKLLNQQQEIVDLCETIILLIRHKPNYKKSFDRVVGIQHGALAKKDTRKKDVFWLWALASRLNVRY